MARYMLLYVGLLGTVASLVAAAGFLRELLRGTAPPRVKCALALLAIAFGLEGGGAFAVRGAFTGPMPTGGFLCLLTGAVVLGMAGACMWGRLESACHQRPSSTRGLGGTSCFVRASRIFLVLMVPVVIALLILVARFVFHGRPSPGNVALLIVAAVAGIQVIVGAVRIWCNRLPTGK